MHLQSSDADAWASRTTRSTMGLLVWTVAWVASLALAAFGPQVLWNDQVALTALALGVNVLIGIGMLFANKRYLQSLDELQRMIQLQAMAWSLGAGLVFGMTWTLLDRFDLVAFEAQIAHLVIFMAVVYLVGCVVGLRRYR